MPWFSFMTLFLLVVEADLRELGTLRTIANRPGDFCGCVPPLIDLDVTALVELNAGSIETDSVAVCLAAGRNEKIPTVESAISAQVIQIDSNASAGMCLEPANHLGVQKNL